MQKKTEQQRQPTEGGAYTRDPKTGVLTRTNKPTKPAAPSVDERDIEPTEDERDGTT